MIKFIIFFREEAKKRTTIVPTAILPDTTSDNQITNTTDGPTTQLQRKRRNADDVEGLLKMVKIGKFKINLW